MVIFGLSPEAVTIIVITLIVIVITMFVVNAARKYDTSTTKPATSGSTASELERLKRLLDSGAITKEEYEKAKRKLLYQ